MSGMPLSIMAKNKEPFDGNPENDRCCDHR